MSRVYLDLFLLTVCGAVIVTSCASSDTLPVPVERGNGFVGLGQANAGSGGQPVSGRQTEATVEPDSGGQTGTDDEPIATGGRGTGGRLGSGGQTATGGKSASASGGGFSVWTGTSLGGKSSTGGGITGFGLITGRGSATATGGAQSTGGATGSGNSPGVGGSGTSDGSDPVLPAISGTCPTFKTGTVSVAGLSGISLQVGAKKEGTGSLLFYWHGTGMSASEANMQLPSSVKQEILDQGGIIVAFQGSLGSGGDCSGTATFSKDDFKVADQIAACAVKDHGIDPRRIYATGCSAGGLQSGCMAAMRSSYLAATAPNSGGQVMPVTLQDSKHVPAVMTMHGGASDVVIVTFSETSASLDKQMKNAGGFVMNCNHGGGHCGAPAELYKSAWEFMKAHPFGVKPSPYASSIPSSFPSYCKIY